MTQQEIPQDVRKVMLVSKYATPLAVILVSVGIFVSQPIDAVRNRSIGLLVLGILFNMIYIQAIKGKSSVSSGMTLLRRMVNLGINTAQVYVLGTFFSPIWFLLALTPIATAIYDTRRKTILISGIVCGLLLAIQATRPHNTPIDWGQQVAFSAFIILLSLMINELSNQSKSA